MSKILAISDIHIHDYPQRNPSEKFRLHQSRIVAKNVIAAGQQAGADILVIAGDVIEKSVIRPYVLAEVKNFLDTVMKYFKVGYIIWGNHDQDNKGSDQDFTDSCLSVMLPPNLYYADMRELTIDNSRIAFSNWRPNFDLTWIKGTVDVLFTHATISYSATDMIKSQHLDETKFNLAICGDIHKPVTTGKYVSIGIPQKCKMSDSDKATGVIYDCEDKSWSWIDLNAAGNLMKFEYTNQQDQEGWDPSGIWKVYRPDTVSLSTSGTNNIQIPAWKDVGNLINEIIISNNLQDVHGEVLKTVQSIDSKEVDFNFVITRFYCKNWRSIDEVELFFNDLDRILIIGKNGSGKSSLLSAIRYALQEYRFIKDFVQFGEKECLAEIDFLYQGSNFRIQRGSKKYGLWIEGTPQKYNNKKEFEEDVKLRFPFIEYMDIYFFDSDHHKLIGGITPERKSEIISKFFKLDRIDAFNEAAEVILSKFTKKINELKENISKNQGLLNYVEQRLSIIQLPTRTLNELNKLKQEGLIIQQKANSWKDYQIKSANFIGQIENLTNFINELNLNKIKLREGSIIEIDIENTTQHLKDISTKIYDLSRVDADYSKLVNEYNQLTNSGRRLHSEWERLKNSRTCHSCGQLIKDTSTLDIRKKELEKEMTDLQSDLTILKDKILLKKEEKNKADQLIQEYKTEEGELNRINIGLLNEKSNRENVIRQLEYNSQQLKDINNQLNLLNKPEEVNLPDQFLEKMSDIESNIATWSSYESLMRDKAGICNEIEKDSKKLENLSQSTLELQTYIKLTGTTGKIYEEIMTKLAKQFSDNLVKYEVNTYNFRKKDHLDLSSYYFNNGNWVNYSSCSSGQQTILDVNFLSKIVTRMGLLVMDEFLKHLDAANHDICIDWISNMNIGCTMLSSHMESISTFNNKTCNLELNSSGMTKIKLN